MRISCPQCGADFQLENLESYLSCEYCKNSLFIDLDAVIAVYTFKASIEPHLIGSYLKKDFQKMGFDEEIKIVNSVPVYFPFWQLEGELKLESGSSRFPIEKVIPLSANKVFFNANKIDYRIDVIDIDTQPRSSKKRTLYYYPFFRVDILFRGDKYHFYVNAITGDVYGDPIPYLSGKDVNRLFPLFLTIFFVFLVMNYFFNQFFISLILNIALFYLFFQVSIQFVEKKIYNK